MWTPATEAAVVPKQQIIVDALPTNYLIFFFPFYSLRSCDPSLSGSCSREEQTIIKQTVTYYITPVFAVLLLLLLVGYGSQGEGGGNVILPLGFLDTPIICRWSEAGDKEALEASEQACC